MTQYITKEGLDKMVQELEHLKITKRRELADRLRKAIAFGDLSENFDYHNAKEEQEFLERRIAELEDMIADSKVVGVSANKETVSLGCKVLLESDGEKFSFTICEPQLSNPLEGKISVESPMGQALLGQKKGSVVQVETPNGKTRYKIIHIQ
ncbi:MAG: transcription elongation factor GreA [bacterium]|nr:transcription elongation factor GreA [bacterium]